MNSLKYALCLSCFVYTAHSNAQDVGQVGTDVGGTVGSFGGIGLLEMRNARFSNDGDLSVGMGILSDGQNYYATWQATPWLETTLRYSDYNNALDGVDKGLDVKLRLLEEGKYKWRIDCLRNVDTTRMISFGPMTGAMGKLDLSGIHQAGVVVEHWGPNPRPIKAEWIDEIHKQCEEQGVTILNKHWLSQETA